MGQTLSEPVVEKHTTSGKDNNRLMYGASAMQGWRVGMEDAHTTILSLPGSSNGKWKKNAFFAVFDGHGGAGTAIFCGGRVHTKLASLPTYQDGTDFEGALRTTFLAMDEELLSDKNHPPAPSGCTAVAVLLTEDGRIICANAGDSRAVLSNNGEAHPLSFDHKPDNPDELARIRAAGGFVEWNRVNGNLALSRAIGDFEFKKNEDMKAEAQVVTANPDITSRKVVVPTDDFFVVACDGIWDCLSSQRVIDFISIKISQSRSLDGICEDLMDFCLATEFNMNGLGCDNMTVLVVAMLHGKSEGEWRERIKARVTANPPEPFVKSSIPVNTPQ